MIVYIKTRINGVYKYKAIFLGVYKYKAIFLKQNNKKGK